MKEKLRVAIENTEGFEEVDETKEGFEEVDETTQVTKDPKVHSSQTVQINDRAEGKQQQQTQLVPGEGQVQLESWESVL